jgi:hypothetical protein
MLYRTVRKMLSNLLGHIKWRGSKLLSKVLFMKSPVVWLIYCHILRNTSTNTILIKIMWG